MKNIFKFDELNFEEKHDFLKKHGQSLMSIHLNNQTYSLYSLGNYFIEVCTLDCYNGVDQIVKKITVIKDYNLLEPYLNFISIPS